MPRHNTLSGSQLHEMKGAASASAGQIPVADGAGSTAFTTPTWATKPIIKYKDADNTAVNNSTTLVDDEDLFNYGLAASTNYIVEGDVYVTSANGTTNVDVAFNLVSGTITDSLIRYTSSDENGDNVETESGAITDEKTVTAMSGTVPVLVHITGFVEVNAASVLSLQFAQNAAAVTDTQTLKGSWIKFTPIES